jgi:hypothetical protein
MPSPEEGIPTLLNEALYRKVALTPQNTGEVLALARASHQM